MFRSTVEWILSRNSARASDTVQLLPYIRMVIKYQYVMITCGLKQWLVEFVDILHNVTNTREQSSSCLFSISNLLCCISLKNRFNIRHNGSVKHQFTLNIRQHYNQQKMKVISFGQRSLSHRCFGPIDQENVERQQEQMIQPSLVVEESTEVRQ